MADSHHIQSLIDRAGELLAESRRVVAFTGAGVSTESGISDFRSPGGIWERYDPDDFTLQKFLQQPETRRKHWKMIAEGGFMAKARPNPAHLALAELETLGLLDCVVTQNVDTLHQKAGNRADRVLELHGTISWAVCMSCRQRFPLAEVAGKLTPDGDAQPCVKCGGLIKPDTVFFGEALPQEIFNNAVSRAQHADLCLVIGSTLVVYPAAYVPQYALEAGAKLIIVNLSETPLDRQADVLLNGKAGEMMPRIMESLKKKLAEKNRA
jgi:NAD-dependent deacetylase